MHEVLIDCGIDQVHAAIIQGAAFNQENMVCTIITLPHAYMYI